MAIEREVLIAQPATADGMKISWGGVFGGVLAGVGTLMLLTTLGLAIGITVTDPRNPDAGTLRTGVAVWTTLTLLISLFVAGWASTRLSMLWERTTAMFEGALVWVMSLILILYLTANGVELVAPGAFGMLGSPGAGADTAVQVKPEVTAGAWLAFAALVVSLLAAIGGAAVGRRSVLKTDAG